MPLVYACISPHGAEAVRELVSVKEANKFAKTTGGLVQLAEDVKKSKPQTIVIASPHNLRIKGKIAVVTSENSSGFLKGTKGKEIALRCKCDIEFATDLLESSEEASLPVVGANYGTFGGPTSDMPMDWGTLIPLWFFMKRNSIRPRVVVVCPSREIPLAQNALFGECIAKLSEASEKRIVFVASADQAHAHSRTGPYGFNRAAVEYDRNIIDAVETNKIRSILKLDPKFVENAKPDSLWQMAILAGIARRVKLVSRLYSYEAPTYYGLLCASFSRPNA
jgi:aromatic ring-opening dioxygenase LigB subunit